MQPSQALNETRLPRAVVRQQERIKLMLNPPESETPTQPPAESAAAPAAQAPVPQDQTPDTRENDPAYWKQRFKVTEGLLNAERQRSQTTQAAHRQQIAELQEQVRTAQTASPQPETLDLSAFFTPEQIEEYGEEQCRVVAAAASQAAKAQAQRQIDAAVAPLREQQTQQQADAAEQARHAFVVKLTELQPDWQEVDLTDGWRAWLAGVDEATGFQRQEILTRHNTANNAQGCARMFKQYLSSQPKRAVQAPPVQPAGTGASADAVGIPPAAQPAFNPTQAEVKDFYKRAAIGRASDTERAKFDAWRAAQIGR